MDLMKILLKKIFYGVLASSFFIGSAYADNFDGTMDLFESSPVLQPYFDNSFGYAVFPKVGKGGLFFGASHGKGQVYRLGKLVGKVELNEFTVGLQFGGQTFSEIIFFQDERAFDEFARGGFELDASVSAAAVNLGLQAQLGTGGTSASTGKGASSTKQADNGYNKGFAIFVHPRGGLMFELSLGGQGFIYEPLGAGRIAPE